MKINLVYHVAIEIEDDGAPKVALSGGDNAAYPDSSGVFIVAETALQYLINRDCICDVCAERREAATRAYAILMAGESMADGAVRH